MQRRSLSPIIVDEAQSYEEDQTVVIKKLIDMTFEINESDDEMVKSSKARMKEIAMEVLQKASLAHQDGKVNEIEISDAPLDVPSRQNAAPYQEIKFSSSQNLKPIKVFPPISAIYAAKSRNDVLVKTMIVPSNGRTIQEAKFLIIREITFQIYASEISDECEIYVPRILNYQFYLTSDKYNDFVCELAMTKIQYFSTQEMLKYVNTLEQLRETDVILELITRTKRALDCLRRHAIYHNDTHSDNVLFYQPEGPFGLVKPCLIDFGKASCFMTLPSSTGIIALHSTADPIDEFKLWLNMKVERLNASDKTKAYLMEYNKYGGIIVRKTQKRNKKRISRRGKHRGKYSAKHNKGKRSRRRK
jgi:hypothetical protein